MANLVLARYPVPSGASSIAVVVSPKVDAQQSKWVSFFCCKVLYCKYRMTVYSSVMELLTGVPVANTTPRPPVISSRYLHLPNISLDFCASLVDNPATFRIFVVKKNVQHPCGCEAVRRVVCFVVIGNFLK